MARMPGYQYTTVVMTHGFMGRKSDELDREEFERNLNEMGAQGWELERVLLECSISTRAASAGGYSALATPSSPPMRSPSCRRSGAAIRRSPPVRAARRCWSLSTAAAGRW